MIPAFRFGPIPNQIRDRSKQFFSENEVFNGEDIVEARRVIFHGLIKISNFNVPNGVYKLTRVGSKKRKFILKRE